MGPELQALRGRVLSLGSGHGLVERYPSEINEGVEIDGVDLDAERVAVAGMTGDNYPRVHVRVADVTTLEPRERYQAALAVDVLHHIPYDHHLTIAHAIHRCLEPGGLLLVKEMATQPRRQYHWNRMHDRLVAGPEPIYCRDPEDMAALVEEAGFDKPQTRRLTRLRIYPQYLVAARRPTE
jgi:cyclopropane fatty-acyl-phospholipid synthase-like methyltransferase